MKSNAFLVLISIFISACSPVPAISTPALPDAVIEKREITSTPETKTPAQTNGAPQVRVPPEYKLNVIFDYASHSLVVIEQITYTNNSPDAINELQLVVEADRSGTGFRLSSLNAMSEPGLGDYELNAGILRIPLLSSLQPGERYELEIQYDLILPAGAGTLSWTDRQTNFINWYPYFPPYISGQGWLIHQPATVGEHEVFESSNFNVEIEVLNAPASLEIAAAAPSEVSGNVFAYELKNARRFAWSASGQYEVLDAEIGDIPISIYYFNEHRDAAKASLQTAKQALDVFSNLYGAYPYESLAIVDAQFFDGMESDAIFFLDQRYFLEYNYSPRNYLTALTAHEVAHNWWFGQVGNDQAQEPWLDEALCIYSEMLYYENTYPEMVDWWWEFRINRFRPQGSVDTTIYNHLSFESYVQAVYMRGAQFLQTVRETIGDEAFFGFLRGYASAGSGKVVTADDFFTTIQQYSSADLDQAIADYFVNH